MPVLDRNNLGAFAVLFLVASACSGEKAPVDDQFGTPIGGKADHNTISVVASLEYGESSGSLFYTDPPRYLAVHFEGQAGDPVSARVDALGSGDPTTWLLDASGQVVAANDDESQSSLSSHIEAVLTQSGAHFVVFRDYWNEDGYFEVSLDGDSADDMFSCQTDSDCAKVEAGCCPVGEWIAVRGDRLLDYRDSLECPSNPVCPLVPILDHGETAVCASGTCQIVLPD